MNFTVYKSSAGSGKTYTLVKEYLKLVLLDPGSYKNILAITFTNKAANEMKERIITNLKGISDYDLQPESNSIKYLLPDLVQETGMTKEKIIRNAQLVLEFILHNYTDFAISTIDSFVHGIIRNFAFDLHLPLNFDVEMDQDELLAKAINLLINEVGNDEKITNLLVNFIESKTNEEKSWNIENDLKDVAKSLMDEDGQLYVATLKQLEIDDFTEINKQLITAIKEFENKVIQAARTVFERIKSNGISLESFYYGKRGIGTYFENLSLGRLDKISPNSYVVKTIEEDKWYGGKTEASDIALIDGIKEEIKTGYYSISKLISDQYARYLILVEIRKNIYPLAVLNEIEKLLDEYKSSNNILMISEFNKLISEIVMEQPVPFIYERTGEKFHHFLVDEFQDTSILQWQNLIPLIDNSLSEMNFNMIVGDGKQAIYRFRNGEVEQFDKLPSVYKRPDDAIAIEREDSLKRNYNGEVLNSNFRSKSEIVRFNNEFFTEISKNLQSDFQSIYSDVVQKPKDNEVDGLVHLEFWNGDKESKNFEEFNQETVLATIKSLQDDGYGLSDIAILCRNNRFASAISAFLLENNISVVSSESLLLKNSDKVRFLVAFLKVLLNDRDAIAKTEIISFLHRSGNLDGELHSQLISFGIVSKKGEKEKPRDFYQALSKYNFRISRAALMSMQVYDMCEELIRVFSFQKEVNPYIQYFLDAILSFTNKRNTDLKDVIDWWEDKSEKLSIVVPEGMDAVQVMTIHKSKGLEFPVVIYPFAIEKHRKSKDKLWIDFNDNAVPKLKSALVNTSKILLETEYRELFVEEDNKSLLDLINIMYVVMTRPTDRLYILSSEPPTGNSSTTSVPILLKQFLLAKGVWNDDQLVYEFGRRSVKTGESLSDLKSVELKEFISRPWQGRMLLSLQSPQFWDVEQPESSQEWGTLIHFVLSEINTVDQVDEVLNRLKAEGILEDNELGQVKELLDQFLGKPEVSKYFRKGLSIKTEPEILTKAGKSFRPDRLIIDDNHVTIIDFKTGHPEPRHKEQIKFYGQLLKDMDYTDVHCVLLYLSEEQPEVIVD